MKKTLLLIFALTIFSRTFADVGFIMPDMSGPTGSQVTIPVKMTSFTDLIGVQGTVQFDPAVVRCMSVQESGLTGMNFDSSSIASGQLGFSWVDFTLAGVSLPDSTTIFNITFRIIGAGGTASSLDFTDVPMQMEVIDIGFNSLPMIYNNGSITVPAAPPASVTLFLDNASGMVGSSMNISMKAVDFTNIAAIQGTIQFDPAALTFNSVSYFGLPGMNASNFGISQAASGKITFGWFDASGLGVNMADSVALFTLNFTHSCTAGTSSIDIVNSPTAVEVDDASFNTLPTTLVSGSVTATPLTVSAMATSPTICEGTSTTLTASGAATYSWLPTDSLSATTGSSVMADPSSTTTYTVSGASLGCTVTSSVTVTVDPLPDASFTATDNGDGTYTFTSTSMNGTSLGWDFGDGNFGTTSPVTHAYTANGTYPVVLLATNACGNDTMQMNVTEAAIGLKTVSSSNAFEVYPNPNNGVFHLKYNSIGSAYTVQVINAVGETVFTKEYAKAADSLIAFDLSGVANGMYHVQITDQHKVLNARMIVNK